MYRVDNSTIVGLQLNLLGHVLLNNISLFYSFPVREPAAYPPRRVYCLKEEVKIKNLLLIAPPPNPNPAPFTDRLIYAY